MVRILKKRRKRHVDSHAEWGDLAAPRRGAALLALRVRLGLSRGPKQPGKSIGESGGSSAELERSKLSPPQTGWASIL